MHTYPERTWNTEADDAQLEAHRNSARACKELGIEPKTRVWKGKDPVAFVVSANLHRRHLDESQRGMVAAKLANMPAYRPKESTSKDVLISQDKAASTLNVSVATTQRAKHVLDNGTDELIQAVEGGQLPVATAAAATRPSACSTAGRPLANARGWPCEIACVQQARSLRC